MTKSQVVYLSFDRFPSPKGAAVHIREFTRTLGQHFHSGVELVTPNSSPEFVPQADPFVRGDVAHYELPARGRTLIDRVLAFRRQILRFWGERHERRGLPDIVHVRSIYEGYPIAREKERFTRYLVAEINGLPSIELKYHYPDLAHDSALLTKLRAQEDLLLRQADLIIVVSAVTRDTLIERGAAPERIRLIPNGVDGELFSYDEPRLEYGEPYRLLYTGTMTGWQGIQAAIDALQLLRRDHDATLSLVGPLRAHQRPAIEAQIERRGLEDSVFLVDPVSQDELAQIYGAHDITLAPLVSNDRNLVQGCCPLKVLEAMATGTPLVGSDLPVLQSLCKNGSEALLVRPASPKAIKDGCLRLIEDPELSRAIARNARERVEREFLWTHAARRLIDAYESLGVESAL
ncbi:MAG: glycosyltransferase family 4 protein [Planctomycetota bacterium]